MLIKRIKNNKGFSLAECIIAIAIFAIMSFILLAMLLYCAGLRLKNHEIIENLSNQVNNIIYTEKHSHSPSVIYESFQLAFYYPESGDNEPVALTEPANYFNYDYSDGKGFSLFKPVLDFSEYEKRLVESYYSDIKDTWNSAGFYCPDSEIENIIVDKVEILEESNGFRINCTIKLSGILTDSICIFNLPKDAINVSANAVGANCEFITIVGWNKAIIIKNVKSNEISLTISILKDYPYFQFYEGYMFMNIKDNDKDEDEYESKNYYY